MPNDTEATILLKLGELIGLNKAVLERISSAEDTHQSDMENIGTRMNNHSERLKDLENSSATKAGEQNGRRAMITLGLILGPLALGLMGWWLANGWNLLQAGAKAMGG